MCSHKTDVKININIHFYITDAILVMQKITSSLYRVFATQTGTSLGDFCPPQTSCVKFKKSSN